MNDSHNKPIQLDDIKYISIAELINLDIETLRKLEDQADQAVYDAGTRLEWIRGIIAKKLQDSSVKNPNKGQR